MFVVRPVLHHFLLWLALAPFLLIETRALDTALDRLALLDDQRARTTVAEVTDFTDGTRRLQVRYRFRVPGDATDYSFTDVMGRQNLWTSITADSWQRARLNGDRIEVRYLPERPWINQPVGVAGSPGRQHRRVADLSPRRSGLADRERADRPQLSPVRRRRRAPPAPPRAVLALESTAVACRLLRGAQRVGRPVVDVDLRGRHHHRRDLAPVRL